MKMSGVKRAGAKFSLLTQTGLVLLLSAAAPGYALAQAAPVMATPALPSASAPQDTSAPKAFGQKMPEQAAAQQPSEIPDMPPQSQLAAPSAPGMPVIQSAEKAPVATPAATTTPAATATAMPAQPQPEETPAAPSIANVAAAIAPVAETAKPSPAEMAIVHSAGKVAQPRVTNVKAARMKNRSATDKGLRVTDILAKQAQVRPLPTQYLVVRRNHGAHDYESRLAAARLALSEGHYAAALGLFNDLFSRNTDDLRVLMGRAVALQNLGQNDAAVDTYRRVLKIDPDNVSAMANVLGLIKGKATPDAIDALQKLRGLYPANVAVTAQLGMLYGVAGDYSNALKYLNMADALKPGDGVILYNRAVAYDHLGKTDKAAELYHRILNLASEGELGVMLPLDDIRLRLAALR